jgi:hypothetical protein
MYNTSHPRLSSGVLQSRSGLLPMHLPPEDLVAVQDVHLGPTYIWKGLCGVLFCDIDGTIADLTHRRKFVATKPKNWAAFEKTIHLDSPIPHIIEAVRMLHAAGWTVVMCTGRGAQNKDVTVDWLNRHGVPFHAIYTRAEKDYRRDDIIKEELLAQARADGYDPDIVFDDRNQVVAMWRRVGVPCVQVAEGDF